MKCLQEEKEGEEGVREGEGPKCETRKDFREIRNKYKSQKEKNVLPL
jgi:hypothetical protein